MAVTEDQRQQWEATRSRLKLKVFFGISIEWACSQHEEAQLLGGVDDQVLQIYHSLSPEKLSRETEQRIQLVMNLYQALRRIYQSPDQSTARLRRPCSDPPFNGMTAMAFMTAGDPDALKATLRYFGAQAEAAFS